MVTTKKKRKKSKRTLERIALRKQDKLWSSAIRQRDGHCVICKSTLYLHAHHILPRQNRELRHDLKNGLCLCASHHKYNYKISAHKNPFVFLNWLKLNRPDQFNYLQEYISNNPIQDII